MSMAQTAQIFLMPVADGMISQELTECGIIKLGIIARFWDGANVDEFFYFVMFEKLQEFFA